MKTVTLISVIWATTAALAQADPVPFGLASPKDGDHFEVTRPLLFWHSSPAAKSYEVFVDDAKIGETPAAPVPVIKYGIQTPLSVGLHHWYIKSVAATGNATASSTFSFTIDPFGNWPSWAIGPFVRYGQNPILRPHGTGWESLDTYNPGVLFDQGKFRMLYRAQGDPKISREGYAESPDGVTFTRNPNPVIDNSDDAAMKHDCEDARFFKYQGTYYAFYTADGLCEATSTDGLTWNKLGKVLPAKNGAMVCDPFGTPVKINNKFAMYYGNNKVFISYSDDLIHWGKGTLIDMKFPPGWVGPFEPCIAITDYSSSQPDNVVLFIAGALNGKHIWYYAISEALFSKADLTTKVAQLDDCILKPHEAYDSGTYKNCLWMNCIIQHNNQWMLYFGAGDRNVGLATAPVDISSTKSP